MTHSPATTAPGTDASAAPATIAPGADASVAPASAVHGADAAAAPAFGAPGADASAAAPATTAPGTDASAAPATIAPGADASVAPASAVHGADAAAAPAFGAPGADASAAAPATTAPGTDASAASVTTVPGAGAPAAPASGVPGADAFAAPATTAPSADASVGRSAPAMSDPPATSSLRSPFRPADRSPAERAGLAELLRATPARPVHLDGFLPDAQARALGETVRAMPTWEASAVLWDADRLATRPATLEEWRAAAPEERAAVREVARDIPALFDDGSPYPAELRVRLSDFFVFAGMGPDLRDLLGRWTAPGRPLTTNVEFARYRCGDTLGEHSDAESDTLFVLNLYLDPAYRAGDGGVLGFRDEEGREHLMPPRFNSLSVMPIRPGCVHWVTPWRADRVGRHTVSIAAVPATPGEVK
ncbi:hypothetical protein [Streptomyces sp. NPDC021356]|uniref:hypothetical protein n=1 Tax=Streptomyces sp. NPDC021356 TaxID=3154900 RepID=UPI0033FB53B0